MWYTIVDDNGEVEPIYRCDSKAGQHIVRSHKNDVLHMEWEPTWTESQQKQQILFKAVPASGSLDTTKIKECNKNIWSVVRHRFRPVTISLNSLMALLWRTIATSHITRCTTDTHLHTMTHSHLKSYVHMACANKSMDTCQLLLIRSFRHHLDTWMLLHSVLNINLRRNVYRIIL